MPDLIEKWVGIFVKKFSNFQAILAQHKFIIKIVKPVFGNLQNRHSNVNGNFFSSTAIRFSLTIDLQWKSGLGIKCLSLCLPSQVRVNNSMLSYVLHCLTENDKNHWWIRFFQTQTLILFACFKILKWILYLYLLLRDDINFETFEFDVCLKYILQSNYLKFGLSILVLTHSKPYTIAIKVITVKILRGCNGSKRVEPIFHIFIVHFRDSIGI